MAMISGPYTDSVVKMLMKEERRLIDGDILKNPRGQYGVFVGNGVWLCDPVVCYICGAEFDVAHSKKLRFPEHCADGFRFVSADGTVWIPPFSREEKDFLKGCGYHPAAPSAVLAYMKEARGSVRHKYYPVSCKTGVWDEETAAKVVCCLERFGD